MGDFLGRRRDGDGKGKESKERGGEGEEKKGGACPTNKKFQQILNKKHRRAKKRRRLCVDRVHYLDEKRSLFHSGEVPFTKKNNSFNDHGAWDNQTISPASCRSSVRLLIANE